MKHKHKKKQPPLPRAKTLRLKDNHTWKAPDGYKILVLDRGAVSFNIPRDWILAKMQPVEIHDQAPPNDNARLSVSFWRLPPGVDWSGLPLAEMLTKGMEGTDDDIEVLERGEMVTLERTDLELVWTQHRFMDPKEHREAYSRNALARGWDVQVLITFDIWVDDVEKLNPVWDEVLRSLQLGRHIADPTKGAVLH
jgi:hypothetical protein